MCKVNRETEQNGQTVIKQLFQITQLSLWSPLLHGE